MLHFLQLSHGPWMLFPFFQSLFSLLFSFGFCCYILRFRNSFLHCIQSANKLIRGILYFCYMFLSLAITFGSQDFHLSAHIALLFLPAVYFSQQSPQQSNHNCLNFQPDNYSIYAVSGFGACFISPLCVFCLLVWLVIFFLISGHDILGKRNCCNQAFSNVVLDVGWKVSILQSWIRTVVLGLGLSLQFIEPRPLNYELRKCFSVFFSLLRWDRMARMDWCQIFLFSHLEGQSQLDLGLLGSDKLQQVRLQVTTYPWGWALLRTA